MEVDVQIERGAKTLNQGDCPGLGAGGDGESGLLDEICGDGTVHHAQGLAQDLGKLRVVSLDDSVEWCLFWTVALVDAVRAAGLWQSSWPASDWVHEAARGRTACLRTGAIVCRRP